MKKNILVISPTPTHPQTAGNRARIYSLLMTMRQLGFEITFMHIGMEAGDKKAMQKYWGNNYHYIPYERPNHPWKRRLRRIFALFNSDYTYTKSLDDWYDKKIDGAITSVTNKIKYDSVLVEYVFLSKALCNFNKDVLKIIDTHDIFTNRHRRYLKQGQKPAWFSMSARAESKGLNRADVIIAIQEKEKAYFESITTKKVITVGHVTPTFLPGKNNIKSGRILFIASANIINQRAAEYFLTEVFPIIQKRIKSAELLVVGKICELLDSHKGLVKLGELDDLQPSYESAALVINPILFGTGLKIKTIEALGYSKPVVTTLIGAEGLEDGIGKAFLAEDTPERFASAVIKILEDDAFAAKLSQAAYDFTIKWNYTCTKEMEKLINK